ncbi:MAG: sulfatase-like hydrolase/transferase [Nannocystaceae bacterium]|nr:sulfatase-like hydrolase/transferase [Nannocystaceae bacterium]
MAARWRWLALTCLLWWGVAARARADDGFGFAVVRHDAPLALCRDEQTRVEIELRNDGLVPWSDALGDRLAYHWLDDAGREVVREGRRTSVGGVVMPGATTRVHARLQAPATPGRYTLVWAMVRDRVRWFPELPPDDVHGRVAVEVRDGEAALAFALQGPREIDGAAGERVEVEVTLHNTGCATLSAARGDALAYHLSDREGRMLVREGLRTPLPELQPGASATLSAAVVLPSSAGEAVLQWEPVREHVAWFGAASSGDATARVHAGAPALAWSIEPVPAALSGFAGNPASVPVVVRNDGEQDWRSADGDALSYRVFDEQGRALAIEAPRTVLPHDVAPGEAIALSLRIELPSVPGHYRLRPEPVREGVRWYGPPQDDPDADRSTIALEVGPPQFAWSVLTLRSDGRLWAGRSTTVHAVLRNDGADAWSPAAGDRVAYRFIGRDGAIAGEAMRTELPGAVAPGESVTLAVRVRPPSQPGSYALELAMVREHVRWYPPPLRDAGLRVWVLREGVIAAALVLLLSLAAGLWLRTSGPSRSTRALAWGWAPLHVALAALAVGELFTDLAGVEHWQGTELAAASGCVWWALPVVAVPSRWQRTTAVLAIVLLHALALVDLGYLDFFGSIVPISAITALHHLGDAHATVFSLWHADYWLLALPLLLLLPLLALAPAREPVAPPRIRVVWLGALAVAAVPAGAALLELARSPVATRVFSERDNVGRLGLWSAHAFEASRTAARWLGADALSPEQERTLAAFVAARAADRGAPGPASGRARGADLVVIQVEAMQAWVVDAQLHGEAVMPFLHGADAVGRVFTGVFDQTAQGRTSDAEYLVLQSGHALATGALAFSRADNHFDTIAHRLADAGYGTASVHPYARGFWNRAAIHPRYGFARSWFREELGDGPQVGWGLSDVALLQRVAELVGTAPRPSFTFVITLSLHHPYAEFPRALAELDTEDLGDAALANYLEGMRHADHALAQFFEALRARGRDRDTVVLVYGDHVTGLPDSPALRRLAGVEHWDPTVPTRMHRVGVALFGPGIEPGRDDRVAGQLDLGPTVLDLLGVEPAPSMIGRSLLRPAPPGGRIVVLPDGSAVTPGALWVARGRDDIAGGGCFDARGYAQPREQCAALAEAAAQELWAARTLLDHDRHRGWQPSPASP